MDLDEEFTAQILSHVPLAERLKQCALVCRWASAGALATEHVRVKLRADTVPKFESWMQRHAGQLLSLQLTGYGPRSSVLPRLQLPLYGFTRLQRLELKSLGVRLPRDSDSSSQHSGQAWQWPHLQDMKIYDVGLEDISSLLQLTAAPQLTRLELSGISIAELQFDSSTLRHFSVAQGTEAAVQAVAAALPRMLQQLPRLSVLELPGLPITDAALQEMARLQGLQQVTLNHVRHVPVCDLQLLPSSITQLEVYDNR
jgi:Leucine-rich repeat (LRR) protein